jgi:hypothetical protein
MAIALGCSSIILSQRGLCRALNSAAEEFCARYNAAVVFGVISMLCHSFLFLQGLKAAMYGPSPSSTTTSSSSSTAAGGSSRKHHSEAGVQDAQKSSTLSKSQSNSSLNGRPSKWAQPPVNQSDLEMQPKLPSRAGQVPRPSAWPPKE